jgi:hypothetical protein
MTWRAMCGMPWAVVIVVNAMVTYMVLRVKGG